MNKVLINKREKQRKNHDILFAKEYVQGLKKAFNFKSDKELDYFYIDAHYEDENKDECEFFNREVERLWSTIKSKKMFPTDYVKKVLTEYDSLKQEIRKRDTDLRNQNRLMRQLQNRVDQHIKKDHEEAREPASGFTFYPIIGLSQIYGLNHYDLCDQNGRCYNYHKFVHAVAQYNGIKPFDPSMEFNEKEYMIKKSLFNRIPAIQGFTTNHQLFKSEDLCELDHGASLVFVLEIQNNTKYFI